jgi:hypothetical protein
MMNSHQPNYRDYLPPDAPPPGPPQRLGTPRPGHGTIYVSLRDTGVPEPEIVWAAVWEDRFESAGPNGEAAGIEEIEGTREDVLAWVRQQPAAAFLLLKETGPISLPERDEEVVLSATYLDRARSRRLGR